jgi:hypothetical protein
MPPALVNICAAISSVPEIAPLYRLAARLSAGRSCG